LKDVNALQTRVNVLGKKLDRGAENLEDNKDNLNAEENI